MKRSVGDRDQSEGINVSDNNYISRLVKYIPSEVIALYLTLDSIIRSSDKSNPSYNNLYWFIFLFGLIITPIYLWKLQNVRIKRQLFISTLSFAVWVIAIGGPFVNLEGYNPVYGSILLPILTFLIPIFLIRENS